MHVKTFSPEADIFREGDAPDYAYVVEYGNVQIYRDREAQVVSLALLGKGDIFGEMGLVDDRPRSASAKALNDVAVTPISPDEFVELLRDEPDKTLPIIRVMFERLRMMNDRFVESLGHVGDDQAGGLDYRVKMVPLTSEAGARISVNGLSIGAFPFRVGREPGPGETKTLYWNDLSFVDSEPYNISLNHFAIERTENGIAVRDRGSRHGTVVNGVQIGAMASDNNLLLNPGSNEVVAGRPESPFRFRLVVDPEGA